MKIDSIQLKNAIETYSSYLGKDSIQVFDIAPLDRIGIPVIYTSILDQDGFYNNGVGYGNSYDEALVGSLGELSETFHVHRALKKSPTCEGLSYDDMVRHFGADYVIDPLTLCLSAGYPYRSTLSLRWVQVKRVRDGAECWAPRESVAFSGYSYNLQSSNVILQSQGQTAKLFPPITCGLGAGLSVEQALAHGALELLQRDGNCINFRALDLGVELDLDVIESVEIKQTIENLKKLGIHIRAKLASTDFGLVNLYVFADKNLDETESFPLVVTACGEAIHQNRERALRKALHEFISSRSRKTFMHGPLSKVLKYASKDYVNNFLKCVNPANEEPKALNEMVNWLDKTQTELNLYLTPSVFSSHSTIKFSSLQSSSDASTLDPEARMNDIAARLMKHDIDLYYFDASPVGSHAPHVVKVIAPSLEGETMSYFRLGFRGTTKLLARHSSLVTQKIVHPMTFEIPLRLCDQDKLNGPAYFNFQEWEKIITNHYPLYREPSSHSAQMFKAK